MWVDIRIKDDEYAWIRAIANKQGLSGRKLVLKAVQQMVDRGGDDVVEHFIGDGVVRHLTVDKEWCNLCKAPHSVNYNSNSIT